MKLVYVHIGSNIPDYLYDNLYQSLLINHYTTKIYVVVNDDLIPTVRDTVRRFSFGSYTGRFDYQNVIEYIPIGLLDRSLENNRDFDKYKTTMNNRFSGLANFRDGFWISTTARFFYIQALMETFCLTDVFHVENDVMLYDTCETLYKAVCEYHTIDRLDKICMVQDSETRVVPSLLFFPDTTQIGQLTQYITNTVTDATNFQNDMDILGSFPDKILLPFFPERDRERKSPNTKFIFDGAAIGQYLGGVDYKNLPNPDDLLNQFDNQSVGFVNETCLMKPDQYDYHKSQVVFDHLDVPIGVYTLQDSTDLYKLSNLHIHSKQLYQFSSVFDLEYTDIITGDRVLGLCDFVILTQEILEFHKGIETYARDVIVIRDFSNVNTRLLNQYFMDLVQHIEDSGEPARPIRLFVYTHILQAFQHFILPHLDDSLRYILYTHNSDHSLNDSHMNIITSPVIEHIYAQNVDVSVQTEKITLLPIGIANSMWKHGDLLTLYSTIRSTYRDRKTENIYVNINPNTYPYRHDVLQSIKRHKSFHLATGKPYPEYLKELASHYFCLCIRGNGIDTHRFWEALYLGVIPVIINNKTTRSSNFIHYLQRLQIPFYAIETDNLDTMCTKYTNQYFSESLYTEILKQMEFTMYTLPGLKMSRYT